MEMTSTSRVEIDEGSDNNKGSMWDLDQKLDQPMDEEAGRLRNMYKEKRDDDFEKKLFDSLFVFVRLESMMEVCSDEDEDNGDYLLNNNGDYTTSTNIDDGTTISTVDSIIVPVKSPVHANFTVRSSESDDELEFLNSSRDAGVVHILGNTVVRARRDARFCKKIAIDYIYAFLSKICRENSVILNVPHENLLNVGQIFYV
ncbi:potassium transporter 11-like protein [Corchorus capsularis]|uniref:Potassium transporter 11-like protein n=1 Tax=Corchorus capsularis TaxID=210143 RepID=A0A1R3J070_COCAP|nr:potassium transporter 11-like protein [Corchorus capsularis]